MENITVKKFLEKQDARYLILEGVKPVNYFAGKTMNINSMPYTNVKYCFKLLANATEETLQELFTICYDVTETQYMAATVTEWFQAKRYMIEQFSNASKTEARMFAAVSEDDAIWKMAGSERLKPFQDTMPLVQLGKAFGQYPFDIGRKPYGEVMNLLYAMKVQGDVEQEFIKLKHK